MIKNERQYRISRSHRDRFAKQLQKLSMHSDELTALHAAAHRSQIESLNAEISEYEALVQGRVAVMAIDSLSALPIALIRARIARGKTQKDLAGALGIKEQQVQRWESEEYEGVSLGTLNTVADALDVQIASDLVIMNAETVATRLVEKLDAWGFNKHLLARMLPFNSFKALTCTGQSRSDLWNGLTELGAVFGVTMRRLLDPTMFTPIAGGSTVRYKLSASADRKKVDAFTVYAHYIAALACNACPLPEFNDMPSKPTEFRAAVLKNADRISLESVLDFAWSHGLIVVPLCYSGAFHGAVWQIGGRYVIVVKQTTEQIARWLFDLLHEIGHIVNNHVSELSAMIELEPIGPRDSDSDDEETVANEWAEDVLFDGRSDEIERAVSKTCNKSLRLLKSAVEKVADAEKIERGVLANHMAWRLSTEGMSWWGTAENLQKGGVSPVEIVREKLMKHLDLSRLSELDREMFARALAEK